MLSQILKLDIAGVPERWLSPEAAANYYCTDSVAWTLGEELIVLRGGHNRITGLRSELHLHPIIAVHGSSSINLLAVTPTLSNRKLFARDRLTCIFCGDQLARSQLTREHLLPLSRGGRDSWTNTAAACRTCNQRKGCRTPEEAGMKLLYIPYTPSRWEDLILSGRKIIADQMDYLTAKLPDHSRALS